MAEKIATPEAEKGIRVEPTALLFGLTEQDPTGKLKGKMTKTRVPTKIFSKREIKKLKEIRFFFINQLIKAEDAEKSFEKLKAEHASLNLPEPTRSSSAFDKYSLSGSGFPSVDSDDLKEGLIVSGFTENKITDVYEYKGATEDGIKAIETLIDDGYFYTTVDYDKNYFFTIDIIRKLLLWVSPQTRNKNIIITGDAGIGKTSLFIEFAARMGRTIYTASALRYCELVGSLTINDKGETEFIDGPLTKAYRNGGIFLLNEVSRMHADEQMLLVNILDARSSLTIPETGETLYPHPDFRFACTGNSIGFGDEKGAYAGEKRGSAAFYERLWAIKAVEMTEKEEVLVCHRYATNLSEECITNMVQLARKTRNAFIGNLSAGSDSTGALRMCISTRTLFFWAALSNTYCSIVNDDDKESPVLKALKEAVLNKAPPAEAKAIETTYVELFSSVVKA